MSYYNTMLESGKQMIKLNASYGIDTSASRQIFVDMLRADNILTPDLVGEIEYELIKEFEGEWN